MLAEFETINQYPEFPGNEVNALLQGVTSVLESWSHRPAHYMGIPTPKISRLAVEFSIRFSGPVSGLLNIRTTSELVKKLIRNRSYGPLPNDEMAICREFVDLFSGRVMAYLWGKQMGLLKMEIAQFTHPGLWPKESPRANCVFIVEKWPVEVRLWLDGDEA